MFSDPLIAAEGSNVEPLLQGERTKSKASVELAPIDSSALENDVVVVTEPVIKRKIMNPVEFIILIVVELFTSTITVLSFLAPSMDIGQYHSLHPLSWPLAQRMKYMR